MKSLKRPLTAETLAQSVTIAIALALVCRVLSFGRGVILARGLDSAELGRWALLSNAVEILAFVLLLGIPAGLSRYVGRHQQRGSLLPFLRRVVIAMAGMAAAAALLGVVCPDLIGWLLFGDTTSHALVWLVIAAVCGVIAMSVLQGVLYGLRLLKLNSILELLQSFGILLLFTLLFFGWRADVYAASGAHLAMTLLATLGVGGYLLCRLPAKDQARTRVASAGMSREMWLLLVFSLGSWSFGSLQRLCRGLDRYMLLHFGDLGPEEAWQQIGDYFLSLKLCEPIGMLAGVLACVLLPHAARQYESGQRSQFRTTLLLSAKCAMLCMIFAGGLLILFKAPALAVLAGKVPAAATMVMAPVLVSTIVVAYQAIIRTHLLCEERVWRVAAIWLLALALNAALNYWLVPRYLLWGAVVATTISSFAALLAMLLVSSRHGLRLDQGIVFVSLLPLMLLLPTSLMLAALASTLSAVVATSLIFSDTEKRLIRDTLTQHVLGHPLFERTQQARRTILAKFGRFNRKPSSS